MSGSLAEGLRRVTWDGLSLELMTLTRPDGQFDQDFHSKTWGMCVLCKCVIAYISYNRSRVYQLQKRSEIFLLKKNVFRKWNRVCLRFEAFSDIFTPCLCLKIHQSGKKLSSSNFQNGREIPFIFVCLFFNVSVFLLVLPCLLLFWPIWKKGQNAQTAFDPPSPLSNCFGPNIQYCKMNFWDPLQ